ncbi:MAG: metallophosphoesterase [Deltaproteobacteria bacterium]|nr:metallophosphoesterase [Deltaproteobacteria bacterium]
MSPRATRYAGILFIGDPHVCASPPGFRLDDYGRAVMEKLRFCLETARQRECLPIILGDLFHVPRDNPNGLLVSLMELFRDEVPWVLVGNHDKHEARLTRDVSLAVLAAAGVVRLLEDAGPVEVVCVAQRRVLIGAAPDWTRLPDRVERNGVDCVIWVTHLDLRFPGYEAGKTDLREIPGIDLVVNGHIHTPKPLQVRGGTMWANPGSIVRISRSVQARDTRPAVVIWRPGAEGLETVPVPHAPFHEVFPPLDEGYEESRETVDESMFIRGLENLAIRKTSEGVGLRSFLEMNLNREDPVDRLVYELYEEIMTDG